MLAQSKDVVTHSRTLTRRGAAKRTASAATIEGSISNLGSQYVVGIDAEELSRTG